MYIIPELFSLTKKEISNLFYVFDIIRIILKDPTVLLMLCNFKIDFYKFILNIMVMILL